MGLFVGTFRDANKPHQNAINLTDLDKTRSCLVKGQIWLWSSQVDHLHGLSFGATANSAVGCTEQEGFTLTEPSKANVVTNTSACEILATPTPIEGI